MNTAISLSNNQTHPHLFSMIWKFSIPANFPFLLAGNVQVMSEVFTAGWKNWSDIVLMNADGGQ